jgi:hypothetical protein
MTPRTTALIVALAAACSSAKDRPTAGSGVGSNVASPVPVVVPDATPLQDHMHEHFESISELQRAIARGHLDTAKTHAQWLIDHEVKLREGWPMLVDDMRVAAGEVVKAKDLPTAAVVAARLGRTCSRCHERQSAVVTFAWEPAPADGLALATQMRRHQWAAARLWEGLVGPSDEMWNEGASALAKAKLDEVAASGGMPRGDVAALAAKTRELATRAMTIDNGEERMTLYGELLSTCAGCHELVRPSPVPGP